VRTSQLATRCVKILAVPPLPARVIAGVRLRRGRARTLTVVAASTVLAVGLFAAPVGAFAAPLAAVTAGITLKPGIGPPTTKVTVNGTGFGATETVAVDFGATQVATATTSSTGTFSTTFPVPKSALPGNDPVTATGDTSGRSATSNFLVQTDWAEYRFGPANTGYNPYENVIGPSNVAGLKTAWTGATGTVQSSAVTTGSPAVANGVVYIGSADSQAASKLYAFSAADTTNCSGTPKKCKPLWTGTIQPFGNYIVSSPAVADGVVYVGSADGVIYAFSAAGTTNCSGTPKTCKPLWTATTRGAIESSPTVANGVLYIGSDDGKLSAFSAAGTTGCSGTRTKHCKPLWTGATPGGGPIAYSSPAVANGMVYIGSDLYGAGHLSAFSAAGTTNCSGTPKTCKPLWTAAPGGELGAGMYPAVANGVLYIGGAPGGDQILYAFSAAGTTNCSGKRTKTCKPLWVGPRLEGGNTAPAVANGVIYIEGEVNRLYAFSAAADTTNCSGSRTKTCKPLWAGIIPAHLNPIGDFSSSPAVANGVVYIGSDNNNLYAFSAAGTTNCSGTRKKCKPLWAGATKGPLSSSPAVANGVVYIGSNDGHLYAFSP
jgi:outer membrane protein assembly factor BamB